MIFELEFCLKYVYLFVLMASMLLKWYFEFGKMSMKVIYGF